MKTITNVYCQNERIFIEFSDNSLVQFGIPDRPDIWEKLAAEKSRLIGAFLICLVNDKKTGNFEIDYQSITGRHRYLRFSYDPAEQG
jgi:hypothetical protein